MNGYRPASSLLRRALRQMDCAFWCLHEHPAPLAILALPTLGAVGAFAASLILLLRTWDLPPLYAVLVFGVAYPAAILWAFTFLPLPCAVFAWQRARGESPRAGACFRFVFHRRGRLVPVALRLGIQFVVWFVFAGLPMLWLWPRTSMMPLVALFEEPQNVYRRSRHLLKQDTAIHMLALVHFCLFLGLLASVFVPRLLLFSELVATPFTRSVRDRVWAFELPVSAGLIAAMAVGWALSLTLLYDDIRQVREGQSLRQRIERLREKYLGRNSADDG